LLNNSDRLATYNFIRSETERDKKNSLKSNFPPVTGSILVDGAKTFDK